MGAVIEGGWTCQMGAEGFLAVPAVHAAAGVIQAEVPEGVKQIGWRGAPLSRESIPA
jgi:hypothetical protein